MPGSNKQDKKAGKNARSSHGETTKGQKGGSGYKNKIEQDGPAALDAGDPNASEDEVEVQEEVKTPQDPAMFSGDVRFPPQDPVMFPGDVRYKSFDDDTGLGQKAPDVSTLNYISDAKYGKFTKGKPTVFLFWAQYHKPGYKFLPLYSTLANKFKSVHFVAVSCDPTADYPQKFLDDPNTKYSKGPFTTTFAVAHDDGAVAKKGFSDVLGDTIAMPRAVIVDSKGTIVWTQDHSEMGATVPNYMHLMEQQLDRLVAGKALVKIGDRPVNEDDDEEDEGDGEGMELGDMGDFF